MPASPIVTTWRQHLPLAILLLIALAAGLIQAVWASPPALDNALVLAALAALLAWNAAPGLQPRPATPHIAARLASWALVTAAIIVILLKNRFATPGLHHLAVLLLALAVATWLEGIKNTAKVFLPLCLSLLILPSQEYLLLALSYPLRLVSTVITVFGLSLCGIDIDHHLTSIRIGTSEIAITDACSGINQLAVMLLLGYILVRRCHRSQLRQTVHYLFLLPAVIIANSLRLLASCLLYLRIGWSAFAEPYHTWFGYAMVVVTVLILWGVGFVLPEETPAPPHNAPANQPPESQSQDHTDVKRRDP
ncbi:MAG TPA: exosortase/archaeosortase family protein, partial [Lentisphaeria bacterium]|nr:exosortase/archaeosortase family protein [Lentisphaerota bacterium]OQC16132.1 MAG: Transmembrane exosortase (Exosortase_EpsH) [Lentisphaerae bacterium ADurb.Bin082]HPY90818.1 exosortase/archaeosortase family protein [Lentisphaeria bacterium]HQC52346.1 exosortase/archaeosortase family protein [Lentisphaeria bacterium]HQL86351.1 exosortase/archaeosortase family protein [Lentisphaeria bacterium]